MDKKKVIELIEQISNTLNWHITATTESDYNAKVKALEKLEEVEIELQKSDWISVEDELPPIGMRVWVCNTKNPNVIVSDYRSEAHNCKFYDGYGFLIGNHVTHWRKIDKLEV